jgi:uncharacterized protein (TIGR03083 family)
VATQERWTTRAEIIAAAARLFGEMPDLQPPAAHGIAAMSRDGATFPVVNVGAHGLPALVAARVCGYRSGNATHSLTQDQLRLAIELLSPAQACLDYEHPNLEAWRALEAAGSETVAVFLATADGGGAADEPQRRLAELAQVRALPSDLVCSSVGATLDVLGVATARLTATVREHAQRLDEPSLLQGWSRVTVLAHLRYVAEAMKRMTEAALSGRSEDMYPGGRDTFRPGTLVLRPDETVDDLVDSVDFSAHELSALWHRLAASDWDRRIVDRDHGEVALSRFLALRLTEVEVHTVDLGVPGVDGWSEAFVETLLPLRLAWLGNARHRADADLGLNGSWVLSDGDAAWLVQANGADVLVGEVARERSAECRLTGTRRDLLALLLGRPAEIQGVGLPELAQGFKHAFPGP